MKDVTLEIVSTAHPKHGAPFTDFRLGRLLLSRHLGTSLTGALDVNPAYARQLLGREPSSLRSGRVPLYVCELCADLACGSIAVVVTRLDDSYVWSDLAFESSSSREVSSSIVMERTGPFRFPAAQYESTLRPFV